MRIGFATSDWATGAPDLAGRPTLGGAGTYRLGIPAKYLARRGHSTVVVGKIMDHQHTGEICCVDFDGQLHSGLDVIVLQRWMHQDAPEVVARARAYGQVVINDVDDWFWGLSRKNQAHRLSSPSFNPTTNRDHYLRCLQASDLVTTSTPYLRDRLRGVGVQNVEVIRNCIDPLWWEPRPKHDGDRPVVGWVGAIPWRSGDLETLRGTLGPFLMHHGLSFHHGGEIGRRTAAAALRLPVAVPVTTAPLAPILTYPRLFDPIDIGLVPLADLPFNESKSCVKGFEYAMAGVPFVAADTHEYRWLESLGCGRIAAKPSQWRRHLTELLDPDVRAAEAKRNREAVQSQAADLRVIDWERSLEEALSMRSVLA